MLAVAGYVSSDDGLGNEDMYNLLNLRAKWHPVDSLEAVG